MYPPKVIIDPAMSPGWKMSFHPRFNGHFQGSTFIWWMVYVYYVYPFTPWIPQEIGTCRTKIPFNKGQT